MPVQRSPAPSAVDELSAVDEPEVVVIGSGVAGLSVALGLSGRRRVLVVTAGALGAGSTPWAQEGIAAAVGPDDDPRRHAADTQIAGAGACAGPAVRAVTGDAPERLHALLTLGARFDRDAAGGLALTREGGHRRRRVAHAGGDATGAEVSRTLVAALSAAAIPVLEHTAVVDLLVACGWSGERQVTGVVVQPAAGGARRTLPARAVVLATGGIGGLYATTTNPAEVRGTGLALALRAGGTLVDLEFVQFHPTALRVEGGRQVPLVTEALRGAGAVLVDGTGRLIMAGEHPLADLAPRDVVARRVDAVLGERTGGVPGTVGLDATALGRSALRDGFPTVWAACRAHGIDPASEPIPVMPAQHFVCGGVRTDLHGSTDVVGLYAVGEVAATGLHGANRLASNSLLEGLALGHRVAQRLTGGLPQRVPSAGCAAQSAGPPAHPGTPAAGEATGEVIGAVIGEVQATMSRHAGVRRRERGLAAAANALERLAEDAGPPAAPDAVSVDAAERVLVARAVVAAASARRESRGCHWRVDHPAPAAAMPGPVTVRLDADGALRACVLAPEARRRSA
jgi:L-aspartate oxidase